MGNPIGAGLSFSVDISQPRNAAGEFAAFADVGAMARVAEQMGMARDLALIIAKQHAPRQTGAFAGGLSTMMYGNAGFAVISNNAQLLGWLRTGTGVYAGRGPITSHGDYPMRWPPSRWPKAGIPPNDGGMYSFWSVLGQPAQAWEKDAIDEITPLIDTSMRSVSQYWVADIGYGTVE